MSLAPSAQNDVSSCDQVLAALVEKLTAQLESGDSIDWEELARRHPEHADRLRKIMPALQALAELDRSGHSGMSTPDRDEVQHADGGMLGDFRILREVGRGGMGIVYEAEQMSLSRRVALKILPFAATMDPRQLHRFLNEARAAASLEHPHIVPVYGVGCERGVHYYSMKFIDGQSLAALIESQRQSFEARYLSEPPAVSGGRQPLAIGRGSENTVPAAHVRTERASRDAAAFRESANWGMQAAEALEYAHSVGVVHRDIKPANLMIDSHGALWVTDFGLARTAVDAGLTMTGDLLGTLRYMSPEQALAKHEVVDHRTDVYSLGVTLYELLSGVSAVTGKDREEILNAISLVEPQPLRRLDSAIPQDLETIVLKAVEKNPADRYARAQAFADDLRRYLMNEPIRARRSSLVQRARKVARRHPGVTVTAAVAMVAALLLGMAALVVNNRMVRQEQLRTQDALYRAEEEKAIAHAVRTFLRNKLLAQADPRAQANARLGGAKSPGLKPNPTIRELLDRAAIELAPNKIDRQFPAQPLVQAELLKTIGEAYGAIGEYRSAMGHLERARDLHTRELGADHPDTLATVESLARTKLEAGKPAEAAGLFEQVRDLRIQKLGPDHPDTLTSMNDLVRCYYKLRRHTEALAMREDIVRLRRARLGADHPDTLVSMNNLANSYAKADRLADALNLHGKTLSLRKATLGADHPDTLQSMNNLANTYDALGQHAESLELHREALALRKATLDADHPDTLQSMNNVAVAHAALGRHAEAIRLHEETLARRTAKLHLDHPDTLASMNALAWLLATAADPRVRNPGKALALARQATQMEPEQGDFWNTLGVANYRVGDCKDAVRALTKSMDARKGGDPTDWFFLAMAHWRIGDKDQARTCYNRAIRWMEESKSHDEELGRFRAEAAEVLEMKKK